MLKYERMANRFNEIQISEASPEKAGVGGSIPSLATILLIPVLLTFPMLF